MSLLRLRDPRAAEAAAKQAIALNPRPRRRQDIFGMDRTGGARRYRRRQSVNIKRSSRCTQNCRNAYSNLAVAQKRKGDFPGAVASLNRALELRPDFSSALTTRGAIFAEQNRWAEAERDFAAALKLNPRDDGALYGLSQALREAKDYAGAQHVLGRADLALAQFCVLARMGQNRPHSVLVGAAIAGDSRRPQGTFQESEDGSKWLKRKNAKERRCWRS